MRRLSLPLLAAVVAFAVSGPAAALVVALALAAATPGRRALDAAAGRAHAARALLDAQPGRLDDDTDELPALDDPAALDAAAGRTLDRLDRARLDRLDTTPIP